MNKTELEYEMKKFGDNQSTLADAMGLSRTRLNCKINEKNGATFNQVEMKFIKERYKLSAERMEVIFFASYVS